MCQLLTKAAHYAWLNFLWTKPNLSFFRKTGEDRICVGIVIEWMGNRVRTDRDEISFLTQETLNAHDISAATHTHPLTHKLVVLLNSHQVKMHHECNHLWKYKFEGSQQQQHRNDKKTYRCDENERMKFISLVAFNDDIYSVDLMEKNSVAAFKLLEWMNLYAIYRILHIRTHPSPSRPNIK